jgi:glucose-6-phosphate isomerase
LPYAGEFYDINAFDQPGVEYGKKLMFAMMGHAGFEKFNATIEGSQRRERAIVR